jgi:zinc protease
VAGDVTAEEVRPLAEKYFGRVPKRNIAPRRRPSEPPPVAARRVILASAEVQQPRFSRVYLAPSYATAEGREAHAIDLLAQILGGGMTSRLYRALAIEKGLAANVGAYYAGDGLDGGTFWVSASPRPGVEIAALEQAIDEVIALVTAEGVTDEELTRAAGRLKAEAVYARDSLDVMARVFGTALTTGETVEDVEAWPWRIAETTRSEVNRAAASVLVPEASVTGLLLPVQGAEDAP